MADEIDVTPEALTRHAEQVRTFMGYLDGAADSAGDDVDVQAFGIIGMSWSWILKNWTDSAQAFTRAATAAGHHVADQVAGMATTYQDAETANGQAFDQLRTSMRSE